MLTGYPVHDWCSVCWTTQLEACKPVKQLRSNGNVFYAPCRLIEHYIYIDFPFSLRRFNILYISDCSLEHKLPRTVTTEEADIVNLASCTQNYSNIYYLGELTAITGGRTDKVVNRGRFANNSMFMYYVVYLL